MLNTHAQHVYRPQLKSPRSFCQDWWTSLFHFLGSSGSCVQHSSICNFPSTSLIASQSTSASPTLYLALHVPGFTQVPSQILVTTPLHHRMYFSLGSTSVSNLERNSIRLPINESSTFYFYSIIILLLFYFYCIPILFLFCFCSIPLLYLFYFNSISIIFL